MKVTSPEKTLDHSFYVREKNKLVKIYLHEIIAFESKMHHIIIHTLKSKTTIYWNLEKVKSALTGRKEFIQVHRSYIISENYVEFIEANTIVLTDKTRITLGRLYKKEFVNLIQTKILNDRI
ncbi:MAG: LytTR family transcriptional regulator [Flavobacterium sp.]|nr:LytTR family transcriptional regulator [Flavobacterium sp.]